MENGQELLRGVKLYTEREFDGVTPEQREIHQETIIRKILENAKEGVTAPQVLKLVPYLKSTKTVQKYLEKYVNTNFAYKKIIGKTHVFYQNGRLLHQVIEENIPIGDKTYSFFHIKNPSGDFIAIQEKKRNELDALVISGGIIIDKKDFSKFYEYIKAVENKMKNGDGEA
jgi:hypothetical protein